MASQQQKVVRLNTGASMPIVGLGTFQVKGENACKLIEAAIDAGYRHIDTAQTYENEKKIGEAIQKKIDKGVVKREDLFISTKLPAACLGKDAVKPCLLKSLKELNLKYVDLYLIHMPFGLKNKGDGTLFPTTMDGKLLLQIYDITETWKAMEQLVDQGLTKAIGVCNFSRYQVSSLLMIPDIKHKPAVLQVEMHPYLPQERLVEYCGENGIVVTAYSPLGSPKPNGNRPMLIEEALVKGIAHKYKKTAAQVVLRWNIQRGVTVIPKTVQPERMKQNIDVFDFTLAPEDVDAITETLGKKKVRFYEFSWAKNHPEYQLE
ncbi:aldo-keto reductase family 1 member B7-like [Liolophura sinensis]|uniref:aldo-keto reductase family 1 member B7-like n=1 Tax=Liolophura sinensis TaxID=3198878 RepID=UPI003157F7C8